MNSNTILRYSTTARVLHWLIAALIITQYVLAQLAKRVHDADGSLQQLVLLANHKSLGLTVLVLVVLRVLWRFSHRPPPSEISGWQHHVSHAAHILIYVLIVAIPLSGWVLASASAYGISWFNLFEVPAITATSPLLEQRAENMHELLTTILFFVVIVHTLAALAHRFVWRDDVLGRMSSARMLALFGVTAVLTSLGLSRVELGNTQVSQPSSPALNSTQAKDRTTQQMLPSVQDTLTAPVGLAKWRIDYAQSYIRFSAEQAGATFNGSWPSWNADLYFDGATQQASFDVHIDVTEPDTSDDERDTTMLDAEWFDIKNFPSARFQLTTFEKKGDTLIGEGALQIKDIIVSVPFTFTVDSSDQQHKLTGSARLDRLALGLGLGDWADTTWVGQYVDVEVRVLASSP